MSNQIIFTPVRGTEASIATLMEDYHDGYVYFTTDTGKIYVDTAGTRTLMGNSGVALFYGFDAAPRHDEEDPDSLFTLTLSDIEDYTHCKVMDLILNEDGCFYRIDSINESADSIVCTRLAVSGSGGSGGGGGEAHPRDVAISWDTDTIAEGMTYVANQTYYALFTPTTEVEGDLYCSLTFEVIDNEHETTNTIVKNNLPNGVVYKFDVSQLPTSNSITLKVTVKSSNSQYNNGNGYTRTINNIKMVEMYISKPTADAYLPLVKADDMSGTLTLRYMPTGDRSLDLKLHVFIDDIEENSLQANIPVNYYNRVATVTIPRQQHGVHKIEFKMSTELNGNKIYSNSIIYEGAWASADDDTPIIWIGGYDSTVVNYENSYIYYMVYDPISYRSGLPAEVHLQKNGRDVSQIDANYSDTGWLIWDISNIYEVGTNDFSISCRTRTVNLTIYVTTEGSRHLGLEAESSLLININTAGRSSSEIKSQRSIFESSVNSENVSINLNNFNWQNNGWKDSEGLDSKGVDSGSFLSIANGASMNINLAGGLQLNGSRDYSFECRFRIKNVQEYSTLIKTIPKYFYSVYNENTGEYEPTYTISEDGTVTGPSLYEEEIEAAEYKIGLDEYGNLLMDEEHTVKREDTRSGVVVRWLNDSGYGFCIGTQEAYFKTPSGIANVRYCEDEVINISFVASRTDHLCYIYLNGILSGAIAMPVGAGSQFNINTPFEFNSEYCDFDLYKFRVYELGLTMPQVIHNYLSDMHSIVLYDQNQITDPLDDYALSYELLVDYNEEHQDAPSMPYATWEITDGTDELLPWKKGNKRKATVEFVNAPLDAALAREEIDEWYYYTHSPSFIANNVEIDVQGTSSQKYPRRNYKTKYKSAKETWVFTKGSLAGQPLTGKYTIVDKNGVEHSLAKKFHMDNEDVGVNKFTWKIDYMESSESYNSGFANLMGNLQHPLYTKHPLEDLNLGLDTDQLRTSVYGYPVLTFHKYRDGQYEYIGKYNMNLDKGANEAYGYELEVEQPYVEPRIKKVLDETTNTYVDSEPYQPTIAEIAECWELKDNQGTWCSFRYPDAAAREDGFMSLQEGTSGDSAKLEILNHFEYRYSFYGDQLDAAYKYTTFTDPNTQVEYNNNGQINSYLYDKHKNLEALFNWLDSTDVNTATNENLDNPVTYSVASTVDNDNSITYVSSGAGLWDATFTKDTKEYRRQKFRAEFASHLDKEYCLTYFVLTELLLCYDSRGKNCMMASFGPQTPGGEYIWYPVFYDIDTQLGLNNSGAYLWDYDADVTKDNLFSTPTSVLWNNLYDVFYDDIVYRYRLLRGLPEISGPDALVNGSLTYQNIAGAYECNPQVFNSYAMRGVRPIVAVGLDEYYKYLAPALTATDYALGKLYAGYYDTTGTHLYQDTPTYVYACQGDKKLTTELLLRNRLNYLDSWWLGGDYTAGVVENQIFVRANANHSSTSDLFLDSALLNELPAAAQGKGFSLEAYPKDYFDARPGAKIKPFLHQYVSYFMDSQPSVPIKYDGGTGQEDGVWTNVDAAKLIAFKTEPDLSQQITYIPGGDYISSLGDLSLMYPNSLQIFHGQRLLDFKLGSDIPGYKNPLLTSASDWELTAMPLLKSVNLCRLSAFNKELNLTGSAKLQEFRALGSIIERINFAAGAPLHTVHLPETITTVSLVQHQELKDILTSPPVIVTYNALEGYVYNDPDNYRGLYIEGVTDYTSANAGHGHKLVTLEVSGGGLGYNSYKILENLYHLKTGASSNQYLQASLTDVQWTPYEQVEYGTPYSTNQTYYLLNDHSTFEEFVFETAQDWNTKLLNGKIYIYNSEYDGTEENTIQNLNLLDAFIAEYELASAGNRESQFANTSGSTSATVPTITGSMYVSNDSNNKIIESTLTSKYKVFFPNLNIFVKYVRESNLTKYVRVYDDGREEILDTERTDGNDPLLPTISAPTLTNYDFLGWSLNEADVETAKEHPENISLALVYNATTTGYQTTTAWDALEFSNDDNVITLYAIFTIHRFNITFKNYDDSVLEVKQVAHGTYIPVPTIIPYKDDSDLAVDEVYQFLGYSRLPNGGVADLIETRNENPSEFVIKPTQDMTFYAIYTANGVSVYDQVLDDKYFTFSALQTGSNNEGIYEKVGYFIGLNPNYSLSGKVTLPTTYNNYPIIGVNNNGFNNGLHTITHIFWATPTEDLVIIKDGAFAGTTNKNTLKYVQLPDSIHEIASQAFVRQEKLVIEELPYELIYIGAAAFSGCKSIRISNIGNNVQQISNSAFTGAYGYREGSPETLYIGNSVQQIDYNAFQGYSTAYPLRYIYIGNGIQTIGNEVFAGMGNGSRFNTIIEIHIDKDSTDPTRPLGEPWGAQLVESVTWRDLEDQS